MAYAEIDADALIDRLIDRLIAAEQRNAGASYIEAMQKYELMRAEHESVSKMLAKLQNEVAADKPKLVALWRQADAIIKVAKDPHRFGTITPDSDYVKTLEAAKIAASDACDDIPF